MKMLRRLENGNIFALILDMLYSLAARHNADGLIALNGETPYTESMLGTVLGFEREVIANALDALEDCGYIGREMGFIFIRDWRESQFEEWKSDIDMKAQKEKTKETKEKNQKKEKKEKKKREPKQEQEQEQEQKQEQEAEAERVCTDVQTLYRDICISYPKIEVFSDRHRRAIKKLLTKMPIEKIKLCFERAEESNFLKAKGFVNFDWLIKIENAVKVLNGNYRNDAEPPATDNDTMSSFTTEEFIAAALSRGYDGIFRDDAEYAR